VALSAGRCGSECVEYSFSILKCNLPKTKWFLKVIEKWFWFDDEDDIDWNDKGTDCIHFIQKYGV
jgi:hypothetical protein